MKLATKMTTREYLMKLLYQLDVNDIELEEYSSEIDLFKRSNEEDMKVRYIEIAKRGNIENLEIEKVFSDEYATDVLDAVIKNIENIDFTIEATAKNWEKSRIAKVDLAILRLAIAEILYIEETPNKVAANEAVELAKIYCDDKSPKFINGILGSVIDGQE